jgi:hypothetical protein
MKMNDRLIGDELAQAQGLIEQGLMVAHITKRVAVALPRRFGAPFRRFAR